MGADIAQRRCAEQRIGDCVQQHIRVRMPEQAQMKRDLDAADDQFAPRHQRVHIPALANPEVHTLLLARACKIASASAKSSG